jgi:arylsulfatase A-like enzyme
MSGTGERPAAPWGAAVLALSALHVGLALGVPGTAARDPLLPLWMRVSLLGAEVAAIGVGAALLVPGFGLLSLVRRKFPRLAGTLRCLLAAALLGALGASWAVFALGGQFLDAEGLAYGAANAAAIARHAGRLHPLLLFGLPAAALALGAALPLAWRASPERLRSGTAKAAALLLVAGALLGAAGSGLSRTAAEKKLDPVQGIAYSGRELFALGWERRAGPLSHAVAGLLRAGDPLDAEAVPDPDEERPAIVATGTWAASADPSKERRWNVLLVLVDSLRPDVLRPWGAPTTTMPALEILAESSRVQLDCTTPASHTDYAVPSVFSSHSPLRSKDVYRYPKSPAFPRVLIHDLLKARGWRTGLFSSQNEDWGQMRDYLSTPGLDVMVDARSSGGSAWTVDDAVTVDAAIAWIGRDAEAPFFAALTLQNSHLPYDVPGRPEPGFPIRASGFAREHLGAAKARYLESLNYVDAQLARLFGALQSGGRWERTLVVVSADHGEAFYEHGQAAHANGVFQEVVKVPLIVRIPGEVPSRESSPADLLDVAPTLLEALGLPPHPSHQGRSLLAPPSGSGSPRARFLLSDTPWRTHLGVLVGNRKLIYDADARRFALYDLEADPGETQDASERRPEDFAALRATLLGWRRSQLSYYGNPLRQASEYPPRLRVR